MKKIAIPLLLFPNEKFAGVGYYCRAFFSQITHEDLIYYDFSITFFVTGDYDHRRILSIPVSDRITIVKIPGLDTPTKRTLFEIFLLKRKLVGFDLVYCVNPGLISMPKKIKKIITIHDAIVFLKGDLVRHPFFKRHYRKFITRYDAQRSDLITTVSENSKKDLITLVAVPEDKIKIVYMISPIESITDIPDPENGIVQKYFVYCGNITKGKNIEGMILAFIRYCTIFEDSNTKFYLLGNDGYTSDKIKGVVPEKLKKQIIFTGYVSEQIKRRYIKNAIAMIYCSFYEGFGIPPLEALHLCVPSIVSNNSSLPEVVGNTGILVNPYHIEDIANAISSIQDAGVRQRLIANMPAQLEKFNPKIQTNKLFECFKNI